MRKCVGAQGEVNIFEIDAIPEGAQFKPAERCAAGAIVSHSENGHHHVVKGDAEVMERTDLNREGLRVLYAIVNDPSAQLVQDAPTPHEKHALTAKFYEFRISREYDPFMEQARIVAD